MRIRRQLACIPICLLLAACGSGVAATPVASSTPDGRWLHGAWSRYLPADAGQQRVLAQRLVFRSDQVAITALSHLDTDGTPRYRDECHRWRIISAGTGWALIGLTGDQTIWRIEVDAERRLHLMGKTFESDTSQAPTGASTRPR